MLILFPTKRKEGQRYTFVKPVECIFELVEINGTALKSSSSPAKLIDLSKNGCRIETRLNLGAKANRIKVAITLNFTDQAIRIVGELRWQLSSLSYHSYGIRLDDDNETAAAIIEQLKQLTKQQANPQKVS
jgi:hypothetical protein